MPGSCQMNSLKREFLIRLNILCCFYNSCPFVPQQIYTMLFLMEYFHLMCRSSLSLKSMISSSPVQQVCILTYFPACNLIILLNRQDSTFLWFFRKSLRLSGFESQCCHWQHVQALLALLSFLTYKIKYLAGPTKPSPTLILEWVSQWLLSIMILTYYYHLCSDSSVTHLLNICVNGICLSL